MTAQQIIRIVAILLDFTINNITRRKTEQNES